MVDRARRSTSDNFVVIDSYGRVTNRSAWCWEHPLTRARMSALTPGRQGRQGRSSWSRA